MDARRAAVRRADDKDRAVQDAQHALHLGRKIDVTRRIQQGIAPLLFTAHRGESGLFGEDRDAALLFHLVGIQKRVFVVHPARFADRACDVQKRLGQRRLARVHVGQDPQDHVLFRHSIVQSCSDRSIKCIMYCILTENYVNIPLLYLSDHDFCA